MEHHSDGKWAQGEGIRLEFKACRRGLNRDVFRIRVPIMATAQATAQATPTSPRQRYTTSNRNPDQGI